MDNKKYKHGDYNDDKTKIFSSYKHNGKEQWYSLGTWEKRIKRQKDYIKTSISKEYQKNWYLKNKEKKLINSKIIREKRIEELPLHCLFSVSKSGAKKRDLEFSINIEFILSQWIKQDGKCYYTNIDMQLTSCKKTPFQVSIDRIDSNIGYIPSNTVLCCQSINYMKNNYKLEDFMTLLEKINKKD